MHHLTSAIECCYRPEMKLPYERTPTVSWCSSTVASLLFLTVSNLLTISADALWRRGKIGRWRRAASKLMPHQDSCPIMYVLLLWLNSNLKLLILLGNWNLDAKRAFWGFWTPKYELVWTKPHRRNLRFAWRVVWRIDHENRLSIWLGRRTEKQTRQKDGRRLHIEHIRQAKLSLPITIDVGTGCPRWRNQLCTDWCRHLQRYQTYTQGLDLRRGNFGRPYRKSKSLLLLCASTACAAYDITSLQTTMRA